MYIGKKKRIATVFGFLYGRIVPVCSYSRPLKENIDTRSKALILKLNLRLFMNSNISRHMNKHTGETVKAALSLFIHFQL